MTKFVKTIRSFLRDILKPKEVKIYRRVPRVSVMQTYAFLEFIVDGVPYCTIKKYSDTREECWEIARGSKFVLVHAPLYSKKFVKEITLDIINDFRYNDYVEFFSSWEFLKVKYLDSYTNLPEHLYIKF